MPSSPLPCVVVKYGGNAMTNPLLEQRVAEDITALARANTGARVVVVHGGGPQIDAWLDRIGKTGVFVQGMRVTDAQTMDVVEMVLARLNKAIASRITAAGGRAVGLSGHDAGMIRARPLHLRDAAGNPVDLGQVGEIVAIDDALIRLLLDQGYIPVIAPIGVGDPRAGAAWANQPCNINADIVAGRIAQALGAERLILLTNTSGVLDAAGQRCPRLTLAQIEQMKADGTISGGMLPKIASALEVAALGVDVRIIDGREPHALRAEMAADRQADHGSGTLIVGQRRDHPPASSATV